jgi:AcrR family transcriptional regulator
MEQDSTGARLDLRDAARDAVRTQVSDRALVLFDEHGFDETTVDDIVRSVGISARSFFRYFATKEDAVIGDPLPYGRRIAAAFADRPADESPLTALRAALQVLVDASDNERGLLMMRVIMSAPSLRARHLEKHLAWGRLLEPVAVQRVGGPDGNRRLRARMLVHGSLAAVDVAFTEWVAVDGSVPLGDLLDQAFQALG